MQLLILMTLIAFNYIKLSAIILKHATLHCINYTKHKYIKPKAKNSISHFSIYEINKNI